MIKNRAVSTPAHYCKPYSLELTTIALHNLSPWPTLCKFLSSDHNQGTGMSLWARVRELEGEALQQIQNLYGPNFPIEFRHYCADLIESRCWLVFFICNYFLFCE